LLKDNDMPDTSPRRLPLTVPRLGLGTAPLANMYALIPEDQAQATIQAALQAGLAFFDTAPLYGTGLAEKRLGAALDGVPRDRYVLETKVGRLLSVEDLPGGQWHQSCAFDYSRDGVRRSLESSLRRLRVEAVDLALLHDPDDHYQQALDEGFPALAELRSQGVVKGIGAGMNQWEMLADFVRYADPDCFLLAGRYTLLEQTSLDFLALCRSRGIGVFLGGVFNSGILARGAGPGAPYNYAEAPPAVQDKVRRLEAVCARHAVPLRTAALHFAAAHPAVTSLILGMESPAEVGQNLAAWQTPPPAALWADLRGEGLLAEGAPVPDEGQV
jgi:D-threo-aldose 1-dehydrogenase